MERLGRSGLRAGPPGITHNFGSGCCYTGVAFLFVELVVSWSRRFEEPIELPDGRKLKTLAEG